MVRHQKQRRRSQPAQGWVVVLWAVLATGCIPSPDDYPYRSAATNSDTGVDLDVGNDASVNDMSSSDASTTGPDACVPPTKEELCANATAECGELEVTDLCGELREINCGTCDGGQTCTLDNVCCTPQTNDVYCDAYAADCGMLSGRDNCGVQRTDIPCGTCDANVECNGTRCGQCDAERDADFCARYGRDCGMFTAPDNCGDSRTVACGTCSNGAECGAAGVCICPGGTSEGACGDGEDNDCDGMTDCEDDECDEQRCGTGLDLRVCSENECQLL